MKLFNDTPPQPYNERSIPLSGWDVGYAIGFTEANKAVAHYQGDLLKGLTCEKYTADSGLEIGLAIKATAQYKNWQLIGSTSGNIIGILVQLIDLTVSVEKLDLWDEEEEVPAEQIVIIDGDKYVKGRHKPNEYKHSRPVGAKMEMSLRWYETEGEKDTTHQLKVTNTKEEIEAKRDFIRHPKDVFSHQSGSGKISIDFDIADPESISAMAACEALGEALVNDALTEFNYIFATIDYTSTASEKVSWLTLTSHRHSVVVSNKKPEDELPKDATDEEKYEYYMQVKGYNPGALMILGMIENKDQPQNVPNILNVIPEGCDAGYAYNDNLIIEHLIYRHLQALYTKEDGSPIDANSFSYEDSGNELTNKVKLRLSTKLKLDFKSYELHPKVWSYINEGDFIISIIDGRIRYKISTNYVVPGGPLGWGLPYDCEVTQDMVMNFDYLLDANTKAAVLQIIESDTPPRLTIYPKKEKQSGWSNFFHSLADGLVMAALTMGTMYAFSRGASAMRKKPTTSSVEPGEEPTPMEYEEGEEVQEYAEERESMSKDLETSGKVITEDDVKKIEPEEASPSDPDQSKSVSNKHELARSAGHLIFFTIIQSAWGAIKQWTEISAMDKLNKEDLRGYYKGFIEGAMAPVTWGGQDKSAFEIMEGGLTRGSYVLGLDLKFEHDREANA